MKKRDLFLTGALLFGFGLNALAQSAEETLFFYGFEDELASFRDSSKAVDSITQIRYYDGVISNGAGAGVYPQDLTIAYAKDTTIFLLHGLSPFRDANRQDSYELIQDPLGGHQADLEAMGAQGGQYYFKYNSGGTGDGLCNDYEANLFVRGIQLEDNTSYRIVFYSKASDPTANMQAGVFRGYYNSERAISMNGDSGNEFLLDKTSFTTDQWERNTIMMYYQNDSVANRHMYYAGFWWQDAWRTIDPATGIEYNAIEQFDTYFLRFSFRYPARSYYLDDIALYKSTIGGAEFNGEILRVDFGYETNLGSLARAKAEGAIELPGDYFTLTAEYAGDPYDLDVLAAEYHSDGYLYIWLDNDSFEGLENVRLSFTNPTDPALQLKYTGTLYPKSLDQAWVDAGKIVPDFENEFAVYNPEIFATSLKYYPPAVVSVSPEEGSFGLGSDTRTFDVTFSKEVYANLSDPLNDDFSVLARVQTSQGVENWVPAAYDEETFTVTFQRPAGSVSELSGDYDFTVLNAHTDKGAQYMKGDDYTFSYSFGPADVAPVYLGKSDFSQYSVGANEIEGFSINEYGIMRIQQFSGLAGKALMWGLYGVNLQNDPKGSDDLTRGPALSYKINVSEPGDWRVSYAMSGCLKNSWNDGALMYFRIYDSAGEIIYESNRGEDHTNLPEEGGVVTSYEEFQQMISFPNTGEYTLVWNMPNENSWSGGHQGGRIIYYVEVSNEYSSAYKYIDMLIGAQTSAKDILALAKANPDYSGVYQDEFEALINSYEGFTSHAPSAYNAAVKALGDGSAVMSERMGIVDKYNAEYAAAKDKEAVYTDSTSYNQLVAYTDLVAKIAEYKDLDVTAKDNDAMTAITAEVTAATKAMTDRCSAIDRFNGLKSDIEGLFVTYASYDFAEEFKNAQKVYNENKDLDVFAVTDDALNASNTALDDAKTAFNNRMSAANLLSKQDKQLKSLAADLDVELDAEAQAMVDGVMATILEDDQNVANLYQLAIKARISEMYANSELEDAVELTHFIQNASFYTTYSPSNKIHSNENPLPGWAVLGGSNNDYLRDQSNNGADANINYEGSAKNSGIALDWGSSVKMTQTIKNLPAGKYTFSHYQNAWGELTASTTRGGFIFNQKNLAGEDISDTITAYNQSGEVILYGGEVELLIDLTTNSTWGFYDDLTLMLEEPLAGYDYAAAAAAAANAIEDAKTNVATVKEAVDVMYYNLGGFNTAQPDGVTIKVTTGKNGARKVEKILVK
ncbi:MAG: hypothetical protein J6T18_01130 [Bacteroidaceae bacterium]|nr:hypothetical protein [Bacteroidaceae bacterium]